MRKEGERELMCRLEVCLSLLLLALAAGSALEADRILDPRVLRQVWPGVAIPMPPEVFPPAYRAKLMEGKDQFLTSSLPRVKGYLDTPAEVWRERFPVLSTFGWDFPGGAGPYNFTCPSCGRPLRWGQADIYGGSIVSDCCGATFYEDPERFPAGSPGKPDHVMRLPHLDGSVHDYPYYESPPQGIGRPELAALVTRRRVAAP